jgi:hypothetical protein
VAPTLISPITATIPAHGGFIAYAPSYAEMPGGFQGSVVVEAVGLVAGVSNNVNYDVQFDGSAAYNMPVAQGLASVTCTPARDIVVGDATADCTITGQLAAPFANVPVLLQITGETGGNVSFAAPPAADQNVIAGVTNASGQFSADGYLLTASASPVTFTMNFYYDANNNGTLDAGDFLLATTTCTLQWQQGGGDGNGGTGNGGGGNGNGNGGADGNGTGNGNGGTGNGGGGNGNGNGGADGNGTGNGNGGTGNGGGGGNGNGNGGADGNGTGNGNGGQ